MNPIETLSLALGAGFSSGLNVYATVATLGLLQRFGILHLPPSLAVLSHTWVLAIAIGLYIMEFFADKIPYLDTAWDAIHTFIRPPAAALLAFAASGGAPAEWSWGAALLAGGVALTSHSTKASARAAVNTSPEPFSNWILSFGEDLLAVWLTWMATAHPVATVIIVAVLVVLSVFLLYHLFRFARRAFQRLLAP
jgi:membrane protein YdbS with pleckstrin-like domain